VGAAVRPCGRAAVRRCGGAADEGRYRNLIAFGLKSLARR